MTEALHEDVATKSINLAPGTYSTATDYSSGVCRVLTFISSRDGSGFEIFDSGTDNLQLQEPVDAEHLWHDRRDWVDFVPSGSGYEYRRTVKDSVGNLTTLIVCSTVEYTAD